MDYADKLASFTSSYDEAKNSFYTSQNFDAAAGALKEKVGQASETIGLPVAGIAYKVAGKLGLNETAENVMKQAATKGVQVLKQSFSNAMSPSAPASSSNSTQYSNPAFEGADEDADAVVEPGDTGHRRRGQAARNAFRRPVR